MAKKQSWLGNLFGKKKDLGSQVSDPRVKQGDDQPQETVYASSRAVNEPNLPTRRVVESYMQEEWKVGEVILDLYEVKGILGEGGMGKVYKVNHRGWNTNLAVKSPKSDELQKAGGAGNFTRECETWVHLGLHPHIVSCYYVRTIAGIPRVFAEYVEGGSLKQWIDDRRLYDGGPDRALERILDIAIQFAWGLHHAHERGLVHQDVKPANVMMTLDGIAKVTDFGLSRARGVSGGMAVVQPGQSILVSTGGLTPAYCSPEQAGHQALTRRTDIWSWAVSLLEMFVGSVNWLAGQAADEALTVHLDMGSEEKMIPAMPPELATLLQRCLLHDPSRRPRNMLEIVSELMMVYERHVGQKYPHREPQAALLQADALNNYALSFMDLGMTEKAEAQWQSAVAINPTHLETVFNHGYWQWSHGRLDDAGFVRQLAELKKSYDDVAAYWQALAAVHLARGDRAQYRTVAQKAAALGAKPRTVSDPPDIHLLETIDVPVGIYTMDITPDGRFLAAAGLGNSIYLIDLVHHEVVGELRVYGAHTIHAVCFLPDQRQIAAGAYGNDIKIFDMLREKTKDLKPERGGGSIDNISSLVCSADGRWLAATGGHFMTAGVIDLWDTVTGKCIGELPGSAHSLALSQDGRYLLAGGSEIGLRLWDLRSRRCQRTFDAIREIRSLAMSADGRYSLSGTVNGAIQLWGISDGVLERTFTGHTGTVHAVAFAPKGKLIVSASEDKTIKVWNLETGCCLRTLEAHTDSVYSIVFAPDGSHFFSGSKDGTVRSWSLHIPAEVRCDYLLSLPSTAQVSLEKQLKVDELIDRAKESFHAGDRANAYQLLRDAQAIDGNDKSTRILDQIHTTVGTANRKGLRAAWSLRSLEGNTDGVTALAVSEDNQFVVAGCQDSSVRIWDFHSGACLAKLEGPVHPISDVAVSPDGNLIVCASKPVFLSDKDRTLWVWEWKKKRSTRHFQQFHDGLNSVCFMPDGNSLIVGISKVELVRKASKLPLERLDLASEKSVQVFQDHDDLVEAHDISADGRRMVSASSDKTLRLWDVNSGQCIQVLAGHTASVCATAITRDASLIVSGSCDNNIKLWESASGKCLHTFVGHTDTVHAVIFSPDDQYILSASEDRTLRLWDVHSYECLRVFEGHADAVMAAVFSSDGRYILSGGYDKNIIVWELDWNWNFPR